MEKKESEREASKGNKKRLKSAFPVNIEYTQPNIKKE